RPGLHGALEGSDRLIPLAQALERVAKIEMRVGVILLQREATMERCNRFVRLAKRGQGNAQIVVKVRDIRAQSERLLDVINSKVMLAALTCDDAKEMNRVGPRGVGRKDLSINLFGVVQTIGLVMLDTDRQRIIDGLHWTFSADMQRPHGT